MQCHLLVMVLPGLSEKYISEGLRALHRCSYSYSYHVFGIFAV